MSTSLLTLGDRAAVLPEVAVHVYQADSIVLPRTLFRMGLGSAGDLTGVPTAVGDFEVPTALMRADRMQALRRNLEFSLQHESDEIEFLNLLSAELDAELRQDADQIATVRAAATAVFKRMHQLREEDRDDVWARVLEHAVAPRLIGHVDREPAVDLVEEPARCVEGTFRAGLEGLGTLACPWPTGRAPFRHIDAAAR